MGAVLDVILPFFALIGCGFFAARRRLLPEGAIAGLNVYVWYFALPCMAFRALALRPLSESFDGRFVAAWLAGGWALYVGVAALGRVLFRAPAGEALLLGQGAQLGNVGYMGIPLMFSLHGETGAALAVLAMLCDTLLIQVPTLALLEMTKSRGGDPFKVAANVLKGFVRIPVVSGVALAVVVVAAGIRPPAAVTFFSDMLGRTAGPVALFAIGASLAGRRIADGLPEVGLMVVCKLALAPLVAAAAMGLFLGGGERFVVGVLLAALPVGGNYYLVAQNSGFSGARASSAILISTVVAVASFSSVAAWMAG